MHSFDSYKRVNKVNSRKEFFNVDINELEFLVYNIDPTAEFTTTMIAEEYNQSLSSTENYVISETLDNYINDEID